MLSSAVAAAVRKKAFEVHVLLLRSIWWCLWMCMKEVEAGHHAAVNTV